MTNAVSVAQYGSSGTTLGFKNRLINGNMVINQRGYSGTPTNATYTLDRYFYNSDSTRVTISQSSTAPTGFSNSILVTSNAASSISTSQYTNLCQIIEGYNIADLAWGTASAKTVTLSFWVYCSLTGTFGGAVRNAGTGGYYGYPFTYTISSANTWTQVSVTIPGPTSYTWLTSNDQGVYVWWDFGTGTTYTNTAGTWVNQNVVGANGTTKLVNTNGATWYMTGAQFEVGTAATNFDFRSYTTELQFCQRYCQVFKGSDGVANSYVRMGYGYFSGTGSALCYISNKVNMRTQPSVTVSGTFTLYNGTFYTINNANITIDGATTTWMTGLSLNGSGYPGGGLVCDFITNNNPASILTLSAEL